MTLPASASAFCLATRTNSARLLDKDRSHVRQSPDNPRQRRSAHCKYKQASKQPISTGATILCKHHLRLAQTHIICQNTALSFEIFVQQPLEPFHLEGHQIAPGDAIRLFLRGHKAPCRIIIPGANLGWGQDGDGNVPGCKVFGKTVLISSVKR